MNTIQVYKNERLLEEDASFIPYAILREIRLWQRGESQVCKYVLSPTCTYSWDWKKEVLTTTKSSGNMTLT